MTDSSDPVIKVRWLSVEKGNPATSGLVRLEWKAFPSTYRFLNLAQVKELIHSLTEAAACTCPAGFCDGWDNELCVSRGCLLAVGKAA